MTTSPTTALATFGGGCFWCLDAVFRRLRGVKQISSGYAGGHVANPTYRHVCEGTTGHAEVVQVEYEPAQVSYRDLLDVFFGTHDPTTPDRQGGDVGPQYRSIILAHDEEQARVARETIAELEADRTFGAPIVTQVEPLREFWPAEAYHQDYYDRNRWQPYCVAVIGPKVAKLRAKYRDKLAPTG